MTDEAKALVERKLTHNIIKAIWRKHGGSQHGPIVEHYTIEEQAFYRFAEDLIETQAREIERLERLVKYWTARAALAGDSHDQ